MNVELAQDARAMIGEGPVWDDRTERLHWVDIAAGLVHRYAPADGTDPVIDVGQLVGSLGLGAQGGLVLAVRDGFALIPAGQDHASRLIPVEADVPNSRMNDGRCDPRGRFWAGTMDRDHAVEAGSLYRLDGFGGSLVVEHMLPGLTISNGMDWSANGSLMYFIDSATQRIDTFDFDVDTGAIANRRTFADIPERDGLPDGLVVDAEGGVWVALFGRGTVRRYTSKGEISMEIAMPVSLVTSVAFGGPGLTDLYVTTARHRLDASQQGAQPHAGSLFVCRPGAIGRLSHRFAWI